MDKFKPGDIVIRIRCKNGPVEVGAIGTVIKRDPKRKEGVVAEFNGERNFHFIQYLELSPLNDSPLMKALR